MEITKLHKHTERETGTKRNHKVTWTYKKINPSIVQAFKQLDDESLSFSLKNKTQNFLARRSKTYKKRLYLVLSSLQILCCCYNGHFTSFISLKTLTSFFVCFFLQLLKNVSFLLSFPFLFKCSVVLWWQLSVNCPCIKFPPFPYAYFHFLFHSFFGQTRKQVPSVKLISIKGQFVCTAKHMQIFSFFFILIKSSIVNKFSVESLLV